MERYIGKVVQLIYIDRHRNVTIRDVRVLSVKGGRMKGYCFSAQAIRIFSQENVVDIELVRRHA
ncbi:hypothetical protein D3P08_03660 [Paenibacillus nanensis]|uniref:WYL domain-containing protein n=1 Tax=Paenibacillus nanensis TaxID=393251 RepID=A0A3A1VG21_9BACL|nr:hypothetical protein [Paenibacillus nanensis]RIX59264.1 hypothetical protein D3P08_03660 [Paenibacillus nanensis]